MGTARNCEGKEPDDTGTTEDVPLEPSGEVQIDYLPEPPEAPEGKRIHRRRPLPLVPEGDDEHRRSPIEKD